MARLLNLCYASRIVLLFLVGSRLDHVPDKRLLIVRKAGETNQRFVWKGVVLEGERPKKRNNPNRNMKKMKVVKKKQINKEERYKKEIP
jgi:hypothetical protein